jgi:hypothetical protein
MLAITSAVSGAGPVPMELSLVNDLSQRRRIQ